MTDPPHTTRESGAAVAPSPLNREHRSAPTQAPVTIGGGSLTTTTRRCTRSQNPAPQDPALASGRMPPPEASAPDRMRRREWCRSRHSHAQCDAAHKRAAQPDQSARCELGYAPLPEHWAWSFSDRVRVALSAVRRLGGGARLGRPVVGRRRADQRSARRGSVMAQQPVPVAWVWAAPRRGSWCVTVGRGAWGAAGFACAPVDRQSRPAIGTHPRLAGLQAVAL
jgi:hypothetical protein